MCAFPAAVHINAMLADRVSLAFHRPFHVLNVGAHVPVVVCDVIDSFLSVDIACSGNKALNSCPLFGSAAVPVPCGYESHACHLCACIVILLCFAAASEQLTACLRVSFCAFVGFADVKCHAAMVCCLKVSTHLASGGWIIAASQCRLLMLFAQHCISRGLSPNSGITAQQHTDEGFCQRLVFEP
jgi:hypothetical protein